MAALRRRRRQTAQALDLERRALLCDDTAHAEVLMQQAARMRRNLPPEAPGGS